MLIGLKRILNFNPTNAKHFELSRFFVFLNIKQFELSPTIHHVVSSVTPYVPHILNFSTLYTTKFEL